MALSVYTHPCLPMLMCVPVLIGPLQPTLWRVTAWREEVPQVGQTREQLRNSCTELPPGWATGLSCETSETC